MITIGIDPVIVQIGHFALRWYGIFIALAVFAVVFIARRELRRKGLDGDFILSLFLWGLIGGVLGARVFHIVDNLGFYLAHPSALLTPELNGLAAYGAIAGGLVATVIYTKVKKFPTLKLLDAAAVGIPVATIIGRIGCTINGDSYGSATNGSWGIIYTNPNALAPLGVATQPTTLYEMAWSLLSFGLLFTLRKRVVSDGVLFFIYVGLYSFGRFIISFWRVNNYVLFGLREAQVLALLGMAIAIPAVFYLLKFRATGRLIDEEAMA
jgi:phosphatidylglycerol:prolipoprotein diacylglycerol transferase